MMASIKWVHSKGPRKYWQNRWVEGAEHQWIRNMRSESVNLRKTSRLYWFSLHWHWFMAGWWVADSASLDWIIRSVSTSFCNEKKFPNFWNTARETRVCVPLAVLHHQYLFIKPSFEEKNLSSWTTRFRSSTSQCSLQGQHTLNSSQCHPEIAIVAES